MDTVEWQFRKGPDGDHGYVLAIYAEEKKIWELSLLRFAARCPFDSLRSLRAERKDFLLFCYPPLKRRAITSRPAGAGPDSA